MASRIKISQREIDKYTEKVLSRKLAAVGEYAVGVARMKAPADNGDLRRSIKSRLENKGKTVLIFTNLFYADFVEHGTGIYRDDGTGRKTAWLTPKVKVHGKWMHFWTKGQRPVRFMRELLKRNRKKEIL